MTANRGRCTIDLCRFVHAGASIRARERVDSCMPRVDSCAARRLVRAVCRLGIMWLSAG